MCRSDPVARVQVKVDLDFCLFTRAHLCAGLEEHSPSEVRTYFFFNEGKGHLEPQPRNCLKSSALRKLEVRQLWRGDRSHEIESLQIVADTVEQPLPAIAMLTARSEFKQFLLCVTASGLPMTYTRHNQPSVSSACWPACSCFTNPSNVKHKLSRPSRDRRPTKRVKFHALLNGPAGRRYAHR